MSRRILPSLEHAIVLVLLAALGPLPVVRAGSVGGGPGEVLGADLDAALVRVALEGRVVDTAGVPAPGAVVVTSAGGRAVCDADGAYVLEVGVPTEASRVQVTAVTRRGGAALVASRRVTVAGAAASVGTLVLEASSTCNPEWLPTFGDRSGVSGYIASFGVFDDGSGPALYIGGGFQVGGASEAWHIARWDGQRWSPVGEGLGFSGSVDALAVFDDGGGPALYAGGSFYPGIARWDGTSWTTPAGAVNGAIWDLEVHDDGSGPALYVAGQFSNAGGLLTAGIARWDGASWSSVGGGMNLLVYALTLFDDGSGTKLYAGGRFTSAGGVPVERVAGWDGSAWSALGDGLDDDVQALSVYDDGNGPRLVAGGRFLQSGAAPAEHVAVWDGAAWSPIGGGTDAAVRALATYDDGTGTALYCGGDFTQAGGAPASRIARWNGTSWSDVSGGTNGSVLALFAYDLGSGAALYVGGGFWAVESLTALRVARWDGSWGLLGQGVSDIVTAVAHFDDGAGDALVVAGQFQNIGTQPLEHIGAWDGASWSPLGGGLSGPTAANALIVHDDGSGPALYAGGDFDLADGLPVNHVARWDGTSWSALGAGLEGASSSTQVHALAVYDDGNGPSLYAGGEFDTAGGAPASNIARWDGTSWSPLGAGVTGPAISTGVFALTVHDDGNGPALYAGGQFNTAGGAPASRIARWDGASWSPLGSGVNSRVEDLVVWDEGGGPALFASGWFGLAGGVTADRIARWDGASWTPVGTGTGPLVSMLSLCVHDDGNGQALYAGGRFFLVDDVSVRCVARWDGASWSPLGGGVVGTNTTPYIANVLAMTSWDGVGGPALYIGGAFTGVPDSGDSHLARWGCPDPEPTTFCFGTDADCPCGNGGLPGRGCDNAQGTGGVELALVAQTTSPSGATVTGTGFSTMGAPTALVFRSSALDASAPVVFGDGLRCVSSTGLVRLAATLASGGTSTHTFGHGAMVGGGDFYYQLWYRNTPSAYCTPLAFNLSNGLRITWP